MDTTYAAVYPELYRKHWWWRVRERVLLRKIGSLLKTTSGTARILDVGCGAGLFFDALKVKPIRVGFSQRCLKTVNIHARGHVNTQKDRQTELCSWF